MLNASSLQVGWDVRRNGHCTIRYRKNTAAVFNVPESIFSYSIYDSSICEARWLALELCRDRSSSSVRITSLLRCRSRRFCLSTISAKLLHSLYREIQKLEGVPALFKGLGPTLVGVIPARSINFFTYGNGKQVIANKFNDGVETAAVHLSAAAFAGIATSTFTNPIWVVKTRMQLSAGQSKPFSSSWECIRTILHENGIRGLYKGLSASYLGVSEGIIQWTLYEQLRRVAKRVEGGPLEWVGMSGAAGGAKMIASLITYPHEVYPLVLSIQKRLSLVFRWSVPDCGNLMSMGSSSIGPLFKPSAS